MHDVLRSRLLRHIEALPEAQLYQALDYVEFLASKYARDSLRQPGAVQKFGELLEDKMRGQGLAMGTIRGTLGVLGTADRFFSGISEAGKTVMRTVENGLTTSTDAAGGTRAGGEGADEGKQLPGSSAGPPQP